MNKPLLLCLVMLFFSFFTRAQTTYYISGDGNDSNNGLSSHSPWKTIKTILPGATYLLKRGDTFHFRIQHITNEDAAKKITIAAYGQGENPMLDLFTTVQGNAWTKSGPNIWKVSFRQTNNFRGFLFFNTNIGFLKADGLIYGNKVKRLEGLRNQGDFYSDEDHLYIYSSVSPATIKQVQFASNGVAIHLSDNMLVKDLKIRGSGGHGAAGTNCRNITLEGLEISEIGGSYLPGFGEGDVRYGNGIEFWNGAANCVIQSCTVSNVYDVAFTLQGIGGSVHFSNIRFVNNCADRNEQSFEAWAREGAIGFSNCTFSNNRCSNAGYGWSHEVRPDKNQAVHLLTYTWQVKYKDLVVEKNSFYRAKSGLYYHNTDQPLPAYSSFNNQVFLDPHTPMRALFSDYSIETAEAFVRAIGKEQNSYFTYTLTDELPITLQFFKAEAVTGGRVTVHWKTSPGMGKGSTEVERSFNAKSFHTLGIPALTMDKSLGDEQYFQDSPPPDSNLFYRLKQVDIDGHVVYSNVVRLQRPGRSSQLVTVYPNPCGSQLTIRVNAAAEGLATAKVFDLSGSIQMEHSFTLLRGSQIEKVNLSSLPKGMYVLQLSQGKSNHTKLTFLKK